MSSVKWRPSCVGRNVLCSCLYWTYIVLYPCSLSRGWLLYRRPVCVRLYVLLHAVRLHATLPGRVLDNTVAMGNMRQSLEYASLYLLLGNRWVIIIHTLRQTFRTIIMKIGTGWSNFDFEFLSMPNFPKNIFCTILLKIEKQIYCCNNLMAAAAHFSTTHHLIIRGLFY